MIGIITGIMLGWENVFGQTRTALRAIRQALSVICVLGKRTIARSYLARGGEGDWSSEYKLHSRSKWAEQELFEPILGRAAEMSEGKFIVFGCDDTRVKKSGKKILSAQWGRDPQSPPFRVNLQWGLRYLHASVLVPLHRQYGLSARALPVWFEEATPVKKPGKRASTEEQKAYRAETKKRNLSVQAVEMFRKLRRKADESGYSDKIMAWAADGSFCNETVFKADLDRTILIARTRKDAKLCLPACEGRRIYAQEKFTPESVLKDEGRSWQSALVFHGGKWRTVYYKEVNEVLWQRGAGSKPLRLIVVRPVPYRKTKKGKLLYRQPAFLLTTDLETEAVELLQIYFDRWQLEVAHKELKQDFGLGHAQVRVPASVARQPALTAATYSAMHLAALKAFGPNRPDEFGPVPKYQREKTRVSSLDLIRFVRHEVVNNPDALPFVFNISANSLFASAAC